MRHDDMNSEVNIDYIQSATRLGQVGIVMK